MRSSARSVRTAENREPTARIMETAADATDEETTTAEIITVVRIRTVMIIVEKIGTTRIVVTTAETITVTTAGITTAVTDAVRIVRRTVRSR